MAARLREQPIVLFWRESERPYGCFSQWYSGADGEFELEEQRYFCAEQAMMAAKARLFGDEASYAAIMRERQSPRRVKELGRGVRNFDARVWSDAAPALVRAANKAKFSQNPGLKRTLLATGTSLLAEASPYDAIWGIGLSASHPDATVPRKWRGTNLLGQALMLVRDDLLSSAADDPSSWR
mmetsp:Transcript_28717/g.87880  ORF Transcript_28717/g.87880 Transcript_28717/m.87880 type:complete len:182 (+) Transcript_28717:49-594(+)